VVTHGDVSLVGELELFFLADGVDVVGIFLDAIFVVCVIRLFTFGFYFDFG
jgi:hypothetical protein